MADIPNGTIIMFSGKTIPDGWFLCDGTNGTPDLTGRFILGGNNTNTNTANNITLSGQDNDLYIQAECSQVDISATITVNDHTLTVDEMPSHSHVFRTPSNRKLGLGREAAEGPFAIPLGYDYEEDMPYNEHTGGSKGHSHQASFSIKPHTHSLNTKVPYFILFYFILFYFILFYFILKYIMYFPNK